MTRTFVIALQVQGADETAEIVARVVAALQHSTAGEALQEALNCDALCLSLVGEI
jgi:hypothetical protein